MPKQETEPTGAPCWIDVFTSDPDAVRAFYSELFGWEAEAPNEEFGGYFNFTKDGVLVAGGMKNDGSGGPDTWSVYLKSENTAATVDAALANGGTVIVPPMQVGDLGTMAVVTDPGGAGIGVWQPGEHAGFGVTSEPGAPGWFELHTRDYDKVVDFYRNVFGWDAHAMSDTPDFRYTTLNEGHAALAGIMDATPMPADGVTATWSIYFAVESSDAALAKAVGLGGKVVHEAHDTPYGRLAAATDPTGALFKFVS